MKSKSLNFILSSLIGLGVIDCKSNLPGYLPKQFKRFEGYRERATGIQIGEARIEDSNSNHFCFKMIVYVNKELGEIKEFYRFKDGCKKTPGREIYSNPAIIYFAGKDDWPFDGKKYLYDYNENGLTGDEKVGEDYNKNYIKFIRELYEK